MTDERKHHAFSPSSLKLHAACPGAYHLCKDLGDTPSADADEGQLLHDAVQSRSIAGLTAEQAELVERCQEFLLRYGSNVEWHTEVKLTLVDGDFNELTYGYCDTVGVRDNDVIVVDWKFGRIPVEQANTNPQIRSYGAAAMAKYGKTLATVALYQPRVNLESVDIMGVADADALCTRVAAIVAASLAGEGNYHTGEHCKYCEARIQEKCPKQREDVAALMTMHTSDIQTGADMAVALQLAGQADAWAKAVKYRAKQMAQEGEAIPGYRLATRQGKRKVVNAQEFYQLASMALDHEAIMAHCTFDITKVEDVYARAVRDGAEGKPPTLKAIKAEFCELTTAAIERAPDSSVLMKERG